MPQLSVLPASISWADMVAWPVGPNIRVMSWHTTFGAVASITVTMALQVVVCPAWSVMVSSTVLSPMSSQENMVVLRLVVMVPQLSVLPPSISLDVIVAVPLTSNATVML